MKRYRLSVAPGLQTHVEEHPDGEWVEWEDVKEALADLRAELLRAKPLRLRFDAENAVLDAMAEVPENNVRAVVNGSVNLRGFPKAFAAELERRGLKP
jgi:hypothetical protein